MLGGVHRAVPLTRLNGEVLRETRLNCPRRGGLEITIHTKKKNTDYTTFQLFYGWKVLLAD